jgi:hypothetical protein
MRIELVDNRDEDLNEEKWRSINTLIQRRHRCFSNLISKNKDLPKQMGYGVLRMPLPFALPSWQIMETVVPHGFKWFLVIFVDSITICIYIYIY